jgi:hypothetical protein
MIAQNWSTVMLFPNKDKYPKAVSRNNRIYDLTQLKVAKQTIPVTTSSDYPPSLKDIVGYAQLGQDGMATVTFLGTENAKSCMTLLDNGILEATPMVIGNLDEKTREVSNYVVQGVLLSTAIEATPLWRKYKPEEKRPLVVDSPEKCPNYAHCNDCEHSKTCTTDAEAVVSYAMSEQTKKYEAGDPVTVAHVEHCLKIACGDDKKKNPTLREYIKQLGWADGMKYAAVDNDGVAFWFKTKPTVDETGWYELSVQGKSSAIGALLDASDWQHSLVERCPACDGLGRTRGFAIGTDSPSQTCPACLGNKTRTMQAGTPLLDLKYPLVEGVTIEESLKQFIGTPNTQETRNEITRTVVGMTGEHSLVASQTSDPSVVHVKDHKKQTCPSCNGSGFDYSETLTLPDGTPIDGSAPKCSMCHGRGMV